MQKTLREAQLGDSLAGCTVHFLNFPDMYRTSGRKSKQKNLDPLFISPHPNIVCINPEPVNQLVSMYFQSGCNPRAHKSQRSRILLSNSWFSCSQCCRASFCLNASPTSSRLLPLFLSLESELSLWCAPSWSCPSSLRSKRNTELSRSFCSNKI